MTSVFFKNATVYRIDPIWDTDAYELAEVLDPYRFIPTGKLEMQSVGWAEPRDDGALVFEQRGHFLLRLRIESRVMPSGAIELAVREECTKVEEKQGYKPGKKQRKEIKERVIDAMLPKAFRQQRDTWVWIDLHGRRMVVDSTTPSVCDAVIGHLAKAINPFPLSQLNVKVSPAQAMTRWLADDMAPPAFTIDTIAELHGAGDGSAAVLAFRNMAIDTPDVLRHIHEGKQCALLGMTWMDRISFILTEGMTLKRIIALDVLTNAKDRSARTEDDEFAADFVLMTSELANVIRDLEIVLGGEDLDLVQRAQAEGDEAPQDQVATQPSPSLDSPNTDEDGHDELISRAIDLVSAKQRASVSLIQRHLRVGYNRAARLLDALEAREIVSPIDSTGAREVLVA